MNPYQSIAEAYRRNHPTSDLDGLLAWHIHYGFVFSTPQFFIMGRAVNRHAFAPERLEETPADDQNCWFIHAMAGDMAKAWSILPYPLGWLAFERIHGGQKELQVISTERMRRLTETLTHVNQ